MLTLGIETSCDETAAAVVKDGTRLLSNAIHSQVPIHARYGGVVPELASRSHIMAIIPVVEQALDDARVRLREIDLVAVTRGPGLVGSLLVGLQTAKMLAYVHDIPLEGVNHIVGHLLSPFVDEDCAPRMSFPYVALVVSGGHTTLIHARENGVFIRLGRTLDDAAGEAFDKVAKRLGAPYPGGPYIERAAAGGDPSLHPLPQPLPGRSIDFSFSGLKTAASLKIAELEARDPGRSWLADLCASVQEAVVKSLVRKALAAVTRTHCDRLVVSGGVACNQALRTTVLRAGEREGIEVIIPRPILCTDNGAMIACAGTFAFQRKPRKGFTEFSIDVDTALPLSPQS